MDLTVVWACVIAFVIAAYVVMDGFDLGIGMLFPTLPVGSHRDLAMNSIAPVWDGNETWLILGGGGLMAAFPLAYAIVLPALYAPLIAMLLGLVFRGVAFEFRWRDARHRRFWDASFFAGSLIATLAQGITLGALLQGITISGRAYAGGWWDWLSPYSILTGISLCVGYVLLGACWLVMKTEDELRSAALGRAKTFGAVLILCIAAVSAYTPFLEAEYYRRWFQWPIVLATANVPLLVVIVGVAFFRSLAVATKRGSSAARDRAPFLLALLLFGLVLAGLAISIWPDVVPGRVSIWEAASPEQSQLFMLVGVMVLVPMIVAYTVWSYWVFRGKVGADGYHSHATPH